VDGPAEVQAISRDAESMRRRIVTELEATRAATEALSQHGPVVLALRGALASRTDRTAGELHWVNAGHPPALVVDRRRRERVVELGPTGPLVSSVSAGWTVARGPFGPDDLLLAATDGVLEARDADGRELGADGLLQVLRGLPVW